MTGGSTLEDNIIKFDSASAAGSSQPPKDAIAGHASHTSVLGVLDNASVISAANILQYLVGLSSLIHAESENSAQVRVYAKLAEEQLQALGKLMRPMLWNPLE
jgi:hypothetical protein